MALICPICRHENLDQAAFCSACEAPLPRETTGPQLRKTVTIVFSDVVGSSTLGERLDAEVLAGVLRRYFERMRGVLHAYGGTVEKFIGDAIVAVFGYPRSHEDDALRAVRSAEEMRAELSRLNAELSEELGIVLETRTGVNTGEVLVGAMAPGSNFAAGDVMDEP